MKCPVCDAQVADNAKFCGVCGTPMPEAPAAPVAPQAVQAPPAQQQWNNPVPPVQAPQNQFYGGQPTPQPNFYPNQPGFAAPNLNTMGNKIGWQKFSTSFMLFVCAFLNLIMGFMYITGSVWEIFSDVPISWVYRVFDELKTADQLYGVLLFATVIIQIVARFQLAGFKRGANAIAIVACILPLVASILYILMTFFATENIIDSTIFVFPKVIIGFFSTIFNMVYYGKRKNLYVN